MTRRTGDKTSVEAYKTDAARLNALAAQLTAEGAGRYFQAETIRWLLDFRENAAAMLIQNYQETAQ